MSNPQEIQIVTTEDLISKLRDIYRETPPTDTITMTAIRQLTTKLRLKVSINNELRFALVHTDRLEMIDILHDLVNIGVLRTDGAGHYTGCISFCNNYFRNE